MLSTSLHLYTFNQFKFDLKLVLRLKTKKRNTETIITCFRNVATHVIAVQNTSFNEPNCFCGTKIIFYHKLQTNVRF